MLVLQGHCPLVLTRSIPVEKLMKALVTWAKFMPTFLVWTEISRRGSKAIREDPCRCPRPISCACASIPVIPWLRLTALRKKDKISWRSAACVSGRGTATAITFGFSSKGPGWMWRSCYRHCNWQGYAGVWGDLIGPKLNRRSGKLIYETRFLTETCCPTWSKVGFRVENFGQLGGRRVFSS